MSATVDFAEVEALLDEGYSVEEVAAELGVDVLDITTPARPPESKRRFDRAGIAAALMLWRDENGRLPSVGQLRRNKDTRFPSASQVTAEYGSWSNAMKTVFGVDVAQGRGAIDPGARDRRGGPGEKNRIYEPRPGTPAQQPVLRSVALAEAGAPPNTLEGVLTSWTARDERLNELVEDATRGSGRTAPRLVGGRQVSRAGLVRVLAESMARRQLKVELIDATDRQQEAVVRMAALAVDALEDLEERAA